MAFSPDGKFLVSAGGSEFRPARNGNATSAEAKLWDVTASQERGLFTGHSDKVFAAVFSPEGQTLATSSADQTVRLWDVATQKEQAVLKGHADAVWSVAFSPDGKSLASASYDHTVKLWDVTSRKEHSSLQGECRDRRPGAIVGVNRDIGFVPLTRIPFERESLATDWDTCDHVEPSELSIRFAFL